MFRVSVIHSEVTRRFTVYMVKIRVVPVVVFVFLKHYFKESIVRKFCAEFKREENVGVNQNSDCSAFAHAFVDRSNLFQAEAFSHLYDQQTRSVLLYQTVAIWDITQKNKNNSILFYHF